MSSSSVQLLRVYFDQKLFLIILLMNYFERLGEIFNASTFSKDNHSMLQAKCCFFITYILPTQFEYCPFVWHFRSRDENDTKNSDTGLTIYISD